MVNRLCVRALQLAGGPFISAVQLPGSAPAARPHGLYLRILFPRSNATLGPPYVAFSLSPATFLSSFHYYRIYLSDKKGQVRNRKCVL